MENLFLDSYTDNKSLVDILKDKSLSLAAKFKPRGTTWGFPDRALFIESCIMYSEHTIMQLVLNEDENGKKTIIDGQIRLSILKQYLNNDFPLIGVKQLKEIEGKTYTQLSEQEQQKLKNMSIRVVVYKNLNEEMKRYCYERSNDTF